MNGVVTAEIGVGKTFAPPGVLDVNVDPDMADILLSGEATEADAKLEAAVGLSSSVWKGGCVGGFILNAGWFRYGAGSGFDFEVC